MAADCRSWRITHPEEGKGSTRADLRVAFRAEREHGVLDHVELVECGLSSQQVSTRTRNGRLHRIHRGVFAVGHRALSMKGRFLAAVKACGAGAALSHWAAAVLWGFADDDPGRAPDVTVPSRYRREVPGITIHRTVDLLDDEQLLYDRIRVTAPERTIIDLAAQLNERQLRALVRRAIGVRRARFNRLLRQVARSGPRPGVGRLRSVIADGVPTRSELEDAVLDLINEGGFAPPDVNVPLIIDGRRVVPDFRWPAARLVVEADGADWHDHPVARAADMERQRLLEACGETVVRVTWQEAVREPVRTRRRILDAGAPIVEAHPT